MPLWRAHKRSKKNLSRVFKHNVRVETRALERRGVAPKKAAKRAVAIAYAINRRTKRK